MNSGSNKNIELIKQLCAASKSCLILGLYPTILLCPWDFPNKNTGVGCHFLLQRIFLTQILQLHLLRGQQILYHWATWETSYYVLNPRRRNSNPLQYSCLENPWTEEPGGLWSMGSQRVGHMCQITKCITWIISFKLHNNSIGEVLLSFTFKRENPSLQKLCRLIELSPIKMYFRIRIYISDHNQCSFVFSFYNSYSNYLFFDYLSLTSKMVCFKLQKS